MTADNRFEKTYKAITETTGKGKIILDKILLFIETKFYPSFFFGCVSNC